MGDAVSGIFGSEGGSQSMPVSDISGIRGNLNDLHTQGITGIPTGAPKQSFLPVMMLMSAITGQPASSFQNIFGLSGEPFVPRNPIPTRGPLTNRSAKADLSAQIAEAIGARRNADSQRVGQINASKETR